MIRVHLFENTDIDVNSVFTSRNAHAGISRLSCGPSAADRFLHFSTPKSDLIFMMCLINFNVKNEIKNDPQSDQQRHFYSGVLFIATMAPLSTPKVVQKGSILRPLAPQKGAKEPLWHPKRAQRSHCEGPGRLK